MVIVQPSDLISRYCLADEAFQYRRSPFGVTANVTIQRTTIPVIQIVAAATPPRTMYAKASASAPRAFVQISTPSVAAAPTPSAVRVVWPTPQRYSWRLL